jgi:glycosyltransferase involved in cell wall biosynthesis
MLRGKMIDIIVPTLNRPTISNTILSLNKQEYISKIIFVTRSRLKSSLENLVHNLIDPNLKYEILVCDEGELYHALNLGLTNCTSKYVGFLNDDDWYDDLFVKNGVDYLEKKSNLEWVTGDVVFHSKNGEMNYVRATPSDLYQLKIRPPRIWHPASIYKRDLFEKVGDYPTILGKKLIRVASDFGWMLKAFDLGVKVERVNGMQYNFRDGGLSQVEHGLSLYECAHLVSGYFHEERGLLKYWYFNHFPLITSKIGKLYRISNYFNLSKFIPNFILRSIKKLLVR